ncbi:G/U mismatch-specific uracil-DNA glycosylase [Lentibacillus halodurans]|uniref:G/U mismatch-specific uracil-DNA glycosylase n=1 Tax=Lentibacillus halodurans TaxID=237679 RepID=A0A1I0Z6C1_9BACI|nr:DNA-deoxyinosine glycosylase [Lentibacillus halodurans]SFB21289.1 G/U mismatch-specific uracil-DNA glycosylase [Lentibacillus halodurans]
MKQQLFSFPPVLPEQPKVLILGSMPGSVSLDKNEYYGHPRNHFWHIIFGLFNQVPPEHYDEKITFVKSRQIALWDVIGKCSREGSLDKNIVDEQPNDIIRLLQEYPAIRLIACNGTKSYKTFMRHFGTENVDVIKLPSTSPIPGRYTKSFKGKLEEWKQILDYI